MYDTSDRYTIRFDPETFVDLEALEQHVASSWLPQETGGPDAAGLATRATALNLVTFAPDDATRERIIQAASRMSVIHPCRLILFGATSNRDDHLSLANVYATCERNPDRPDSPCIERMEIPVHVSMLDQLPLVLQPLVIPELPAFLWWPSTPPFTSQGFQALARSLNRTVVDSLSFSSVSGLRQFHEFFQSLPVKCAIGDVNWQRLQPWRELTAQYFDIRHVQWALSCMREIEVEAGGTDGNIVPSQALLLVSWMAHCLGWETFEARRTRNDRWYIGARDQRGQELRILIRTRPTPREYAGQVMSLSINARSTDGKHSSLALNRSRASSLIRMHASNGMDTALDHVAHHPLLSDEALLVPVLESTSRDHIFEASLGYAAEIAEMLERPDGR